MRPVSKLCNSEQAVAAGLHRHAARVRFAVHLHTGLAPLSSEHLAIWRSLRAQALRLPDVCIQLIPVCVLLGASFPTVANERVGAAR